MFDSVFFIKAAQLVLSLCILIILHEGGHFFFSKLFGIRVSKFFLFFDYKFHLISTKDAWLQRIFPWMKKLETEYGIGWIPLGGYVNISGMVDESKNADELEDEVQPWEFRSKKAWQRLLVILGGVMVNFVLALVIYSSVFFVWGSDSIAIDSFKDGYYFNKTAQEMGFRNGDIPVKADTVSITDFSQNIYRSFSGAKTVTVLRNGSEVVINMPDKFDMLTIVEEQPPFIAPLSCSIVDSVLAGSAAEKVGILPGAQITAITVRDTILHEISTWNEFDELMLRRADILANCSHTDSLAMREFTISYINKADSVATTATVMLDENYTIGVFKHLSIFDVNPVHHDYTFIESIPAGISHGIETLKGYVSDLKYLFSYKGARSMGSFGTIGSIFPASWDWMRFWQLTAFISIILAFMNVLPIPVLDGGHALFILLEIIGIKLSEKAQERALTIGMYFILALMALSIFNDLDRFVF